MAKILTISGSLRKQSLNTALLRAAAEIGSAQNEYQLAEIGDLPLYNSDLDGDSRPAAAQRFYDQVAQADGVILATPEFNYSIPGVLKNAIDWASRPAYRSPFAGKPVGILGASMSPVGSARAQAHLRQVLGGIVACTFPYPEFLAGAAHTKFDDSGKLTDDTTREFLKKYLTAFDGWVAKLSAK